MTHTNPFDLTGRTAIVTGAGRGIGREIALTLAHAGADIAIAEINADNGAETADDIRELGQKALLVETDVRDPESVRQMAAAVVAEFETIDILVNNAGICDNTAALEVTDEAWLNVMNINLNGVFWCCREVGKVMVAQERGAIVNIASMSGSIVNRPQPQASYNASKAAVIHLTKSLAMEWAQDGIRVNSVSPGYIGTEMTKRGMENEAWRQVWLDMIPVGELGEPSDVAHAVWYLASDAAKYANGTDLIIDGGYTSW